MILTMLGLSLLFATTAAMAGDLYQWKDANGVTHYSQTPPASGTYKERTESGRDSGATPVQAAAATPAEPAECATSRSNLALLESKTPVQQDTDGDGKPDKTLDDADRANQLELARAVLKAKHCTPPKAPAGSA
jgi:hypothetical protein